MDWIKNNPKMAVVLLLLVCIFLVWFTGNLHWPKMAGSSPAAVPAAAVPATNAAAGST